MGDPARPSFWRRILVVIDDALPMPPGERVERDDDGTDRSQHVRLRLKLQMLSKRGKGGSR